MKQKILRWLIGDRLEKLAVKGQEMDSIDLYNTCFLNKLKDQDDATSKEILLMEDDICGKHHF